VLKKGEKIDADEKKMGWVESVENGNVRFKSHQKLAVGLTWEGLRRFPSLCNGSKSRIERSGNIYSSVRWAFQLW